MGVADAAIAWILLLVLAARACGWLRVALTVVWSAATALGAFGAAVAATGLLRALRDQLNPWYAAPLGYFLWVIMAGTLAGWVVRRLSLRVPQRLQPWPGSMAVWLLALPVWAALAVAVVRLAPNASYLVSIPLLLAAVLISTIRTRGRVASLVVLIAAGSLWIQNLILLARFLVSMFGWFPVVAPSWMFPAVIGAGALMVVPPLIGSLPDFVRRALRASSAGMVMVLLFFLTGVTAYRAPAFTEDRPEVRSVRYLQDSPRGAAWWEVASLEPHSRIDGGPDGAEWQTASAPLETSASLVLRRPAPFVSRTRAAFPSEAPPVTVEATMSALRSGEIAYEATIAVKPTRDPAVVELALPRGAAPLESSLSGSVGREGTWRAAYVSPPAEGLSVRLVVAAGQRDALRGAIVILQVPGVPGGADPRRLPAWLPTIATT